MQFPASISVSDLPAAGSGSSLAGGGGLLGKLSRLAWRQGLRPARPRLERLSVIEPELYSLEGVLHPLASIEDAPPDHFLHWTAYEARRFVTCTARDVAMIHVSRASAAPGLGLIDEFNVGGSAHVPVELLEHDLRRDGPGWSLADADVEHVPGLSIPFCHYGQTAFAHLVMDGLLQVFLFERELASGNARLVDWPFAYPHMATALEACGVPARARRELRKPAALLEQAGISSALAAQGVFFPGAFSRPFFAWLRSKFVDDPMDADRRLYVRRPAGYTRRILNPTDLEALARDHGFDIFEPDQHSFQDQVRAFAGSGAVLGAFGSGMTLSPLLGGPRLMIELLPSAVTDACFIRQATVHRLNYLPILHPSNAASDFEADLERIDAILTQALG